MRLLEENSQRYPFSSFRTNLGYNAQLCLWETENGEGGFMQSQTHKECKAKIWN